MHYRKKPVVVEAEQFVIWNLNDLPATVSVLSQVYVVKGNSLNPYIEIPTLEGTMRANHLDYIIKGVNGEFYPCKPDIFEQTYELID